MSASIRTSAACTAVAALVVGSMACGAGDVPECDESLRICDIADAECREHVFVQTACAREFDGRTVPTVSAITRDEFAELLRSDEQPTAEQHRTDAQLAASLRMLGLLAEGETSSEDAAIEAYARNVLAFYSRTDASVTIVETNLADADRETTVFVLSHEFVHAQQDIDIGLQELFDEYVDSDDSDTALRSLTEGEAVLYSNLTMARRPGARIDADGFDEYYEQQQDERRADAADPSRADYTELRSAFPYAFGGQLVTDRWFAGGTQGVLDLYTEPPRSTATVLRTLLGANPQNTLELPPLSADAIPEGWSLVAEDTLGAWIVFAVARRSDISDDIADAIATDWRGDRLLVAGGPTDADVAVAWRIRFSEQSSAQQFAAIQNAAPPEGVRSTEQSGTDVTVIIAVDDAALTLWQSTFETAIVETAPALQGQPVPRGIARHPPRPIDLTRNRSPSAPGGRS